MISTKTRLIQASIGLLVGLVAHVLQFIAVSLMLDLFFSVPYRHSREEYYVYGSIICCFPFLVLSVTASLVGGKIGYKKGHKYLGAVLGALAVLFIVVAWGIFLNLPILR